MSFPPSLDDVQSLIAETAGADTSATGPVLQALGQFLQIARSPDAAALQPGEVTELGDYALQLLQSLALQARDTPRSWGPAAVAVADWVMQRGGRVQTLEPVVDALAELANRTREPDRLAEITDFMERLTGACAQSVRADLELSNPGRPWRILHLNRAITATRSLDPERMVRAFDALTHALPHDAPEFFHQGMGEMERLGYPEPVRRVMADYHRRWTRPKTN